MMAEVRTAGTVLLVDLMSGVIDEVFGMDRSTAEYGGDGVYLMEFTDFLGIKSVNSELTGRVGIR